MALKERFAFRQGTTVGVQVRTITGITTSSVDGLVLRNENMLPHRQGTVLLTIDGDSYEIAFEFTDEHLESRDIVGRAKKGFSSESIMEGRDLGSTAG